MRIVSRYFRHVFHSALAVLVVAALSHCSWEEARELVQLALAGSVKPRLLAALRASGADAVGLTGLDAGLLVAARKPAHRALVD